MNVAVADIETPAVLVDYERLIANIKRVEALANAHGLHVRPHVKTHKCIQIARLQLAHGATGITASKVDEALIFIDSGEFAAITVAYPIIDVRKLKRLIAGANSGGVQLRIIIDSVVGLEAASAAAAAAASPMKVMLKIDVGLHRCGLAESDPQLLNLARKISADSALRLSGILSHAGHAYAAMSRAEIASIAADEANMMERIRARLRESVGEISVISVGSTPTVLASETFDGITEIRPGNYVFLDGTAVRLGIAEMEDVALHVLATVVSANERYFIIDAGSKVLSSDLGAHGTMSQSGYGVAFPLERALADVAPLTLVRLSEEHGWIERDGVDLPIGSKVRIVPNHACPVANLAEHFGVTSDDRLIDYWPVAARAKVR